MGRLYCSLINSSRKMLSANFPPRCGVGRKERLWSLLLSLYLHAVISEHRFPITLSLAVSTSTGSSAVREETPLTHRWGGTASSPHSAQCLLQGVQEHVPRIQHVLKAPRRRYSLSGFLGGVRKRHSFQSPTSLGPARVGSILFVFASLLVGKGGRQRRPVSFCGGVEAELCYGSDLFFPHENVRETALVLASLATAARQFREVISTPRVLSNGAVGESGRGVRRASFSGTRDTRTHQDELPCLRGSLQRSASTDRVSAGTPSALVQRAERAEGTHATKIQSVTTPGETPARGVLSEEVQRLLPSDHPAGSAVDSERAELQEQVSTGYQRRHSRNLLKYLFFSKEQRPTISAAVDNVKTFPQCVTARDSRAWCGVVTAVSKAIIEACTRFEPPGAAADATKEEVLMYTTENSQFSSAEPCGSDVVSSAKRLEPSRSPLDGTKAKIKESTTRTFLRRGRILGAKETASEVLTNETTSPTDSGRWGTGRLKDDSSSCSKVASPHKLPNSTGEMQCSRKPTSFAKFMKKQGTPRPDSAGCRRSSSDRDSSNSPDSQQEVGPEQQSRARRWLPHFRKGRRASKTQEMIPGDTDDVDIVRLCHNPVEVAVKAAFDTGKSEPLWAMGIRVWEFSKRLKIEEVTERIAATLSEHKNSSLRESVDSTVTELSSMVSASLKADIRQLLFTTAKWIDRLRCGEICSQTDAESFLLASEFRFAFGLTCAEELEPEVFQKFSTLIYVKADLLGERFAFFVEKIENGMSVRPAHLDEILDHATTLQALVVISQALGIEDDVSAAVSRAQGELLKLAEITGHIEGASSIIDSCEALLAVQAEKHSHSARVYRGFTELERHITSEIFAEYYDAMLKRCGELFRFDKAFRVDEVRRGLDEILGAMVPQAVQESVQQDYRRALDLLPDVSFPLAYHLLGLLNDSVTRKEVTNYHRNIVERKLPGIFYGQLPITLHRLAKEYSWLTSAALPGYEHFFIIDHRKVHARVRLLIALSEEWNLGASVYIEKLRRTVKLSQRLAAPEAAQAVDYITNHLNSAATEDSEAILAEARPAHEIRSSGRSIENALSESLARYKSGSHRSPERK